MLKPKSVTVGVLGIQGSFKEHIDCLRTAAERSFAEIEVTIREVRVKEELQGIDGLIIPGGESTTMKKFLDDEFLRVLRDWRSGEKPIWGSCAGMILLADYFQNSEDEEIKQNKDGLGGLDIVVCRNYFGRQKNSFVSTIRLAADDKLLNGDESEDFNGIFIRAPGVVDCGATVTTLASLRSSLCQSTKPNHCVGVRQGSIMATSFHPELTFQPLDTRFHEYFLHLVLAYAA